ncbi:signal transducing adapter molecule 2 isoform X2 [Bradysia coprophila]|uniref:signal transducing adapter molecule 2 isoform X2 n=1 Tax=Bradysia coprophila TaxID=38358 RepID=UPI00187DC053|nr:signal transducing adapter molecule 2 isoform X2 [Bradysia coprophila]
MGFLSSSSPFDGDVEKATSEKNTTEQWDVIMNICDNIGNSGKNAKECIRSIMKRLNNPDPHVVIQAITLLDACINNCGKGFHLEIASRDFETDFRKLLKNSQGTIATKLKLSLKKWAESEFKSDPQLNLIPSLYQKLKEEGQDFTDNTTTQVKVPVALSKDPNVVSSQQEQDDIAKAIELSLKESKSGSPKTFSSSYSALYPAIGLNGSGGTASGGSGSNRTVEPRKVRALYDFEAAEDNELTFLAGEIIHVVDDSDRNWWKGYNKRGEGLFPANFVSADLSVEPESVSVEKTKKSVQFSDEIKKETKDEVVEVNESKIDRLLHLLHEANPEDPSQDSDEMLQLESQVNQMLPLIDTELERVDRKHAQLTQLSSDLVEAMNLYHTLMREPDRSVNPYMNFPNPHSMYGNPPMSGMFMQNMFQLPPNHPGAMPSLVSGPQMHMIQGFPIAGQLPAHQSIPPHLQNGHQMHMPPNSQEQQIPGNSHLNQQMPQQHQNMQPINQQHLSQEQQFQLHQRQTMSPHHHQQQQQHQQQQPQMNMPNHQQLMNLPHPQQQMQNQPQHPQQIQNHPPQQNPPNQATIPNSQPQLQHSATGNFPPQNFPVNMPAQMNMQPQNNAFNGMPNHQMMPPQSIQQSQMHPSPIHNNMLPINMAINQPVLSTILPSNDSRTNIPVYQQQR